MQEENITVRLKFLIQELGITNSVFAENCGISRATLSQLLTGRNKKISDIIIGQIHAAYPTLSILWLLFNEGNMWNGEPPFNSENKEGNSSAATIDSSHNDVNPPLEDGDGILSRDIPIKNPSEILEIPLSGQSGLKDGKENAVNSSSNTSQSFNIKPINNCINTADFLNEIENIRKRSRKVVQITVYYDDSTFESFYPGRGK